MKRLNAAIAVATAVGAGLAGCSSAASATGQARPHLAVSSAYVPQPPMADMAAGYFTITNTGHASDRLTGVTSDIAADTSMHITTATGQMRQVSSLPIPAGGSLVLRTGADHLMLMALTHRPLVGEVVTFVLHFAASAPITVRAPVEPATYRPGG